MAIEYEVVDGVLRINCMNWAIAPSIEDSEATMAIVIDTLLKARDANRVVLIEARENEYDAEQTKMLREIAEAYNRILNIDKIISLKNLGPPQCEKLFPKRLADLQFLIFEVLRKDPIGAYLRIVKMVNANKVLEGTAPFEQKICFTHYLDNALIPIKNILEGCTLIQKALPILQNYQIGSRDIYRELFSPTVRPNFMLTRFMLTIPKGAKLVEKYSLPGADVEIYKLPTKVRYLYHIIPKEFVLSDEKYTILDSARRYLVAHRPTEAETIEPEKSRELFKNLGRDLIRDISRTMNVNLTAQEIEELAIILSRYTAGFGILELLLSDEKIQDIFINAPIGSSPIYINHSDFEECETNLIPTIEDAESWATRFRLYSGRPLDESNPVLDTELLVPGGRARVAAITRTLSPEGLAFAFRRHREKPWTFPLLIKYKMFDSLYAGLMSFIVDGGRALLVAGGRGSGKTSLLGALMLEIMPKFRILTVEDTLELPVTSLRQLGYNIERMKSRSVITRVETELPADEALRTALRLGDSVLIIGEVRSVESLALYEAMRVGALANVVAGTIHGESAYGVYDRVVHDLGVPPTSFKALDLITVCNQLKSPDGLHRFRRVTELTEVRKLWKSDPLDEGGFVNLMEYSAKEDKLKPTDTLIDGESQVLNEIAKRVREWRGQWDAVWDNIMLRARVKQTLVDLAVKSGKDHILEAENVVESNSMFHLISEQVRQEVGALDSDMIYDKWLEWLKKRIS
ncbi:MAG: type II/IV secretion system ATPase subunit [Candidatus Aenigmatarchaeota archaeon]|nr:type II/IV secretion system ATPase subunit [Candidatus Aenigmarchaeota archaeon]